VGGWAGNSNDSRNAANAAATAAHRDQAVQHVYERFETACDDLDSGLFDLDDRHCYCCTQFFAGAGGSKSCKVDGHVWCRACSYQVHGLGARGGQHPEFATTERPNDRCSGCPGCSARGHRAGGRVCVCAVAGVLLLLRLRGRVRQPKNPSQAPARTPRLAGPPLDEAAALAAFQRLLRFPTVINASAPDRVGDHQVCQQRCPSACSSRPASLPRPLPIPHAAPPLPIPHARP
jgi:hypothetical protein